MRALAYAELKRSVILRIRKARAEGVSLMDMENAAPDGITVHVICNLLNAAAYPVEVWIDMDRTLEKLGY